MRISRCFRCYIASPVGWRIWAACLAVCIVLLTSPATLNGQALSRITGTVTDATGGVMPNVKITVTNNGDPSGQPHDHQFVRHIHRHRPDSRHIHRAGRERRVSDVRPQRRLVEVGRPSTVDVPMQTGNVTQSVEVQEAPSL